MKEMQERPRAALPNGRRICGCNGRRRGRPANDNYPEQEERPRWTAFEYAICAAALLILGLFIRVAVS